MSRELLIGTGFHSTTVDLPWNMDFAQVWTENTKSISERIVCVDSSTVLPNPAWQVIKIANAGYCGWPIRKCAGPMLGWSLSWIIPALIAYAEDADYIYKEQDCLCFGDWLPLVKRGRMAFGRCRGLEVEGCLMWIEHDYILKAISDFMAIPGHEVEVSVESKFAQMMKNDPENVVFHDLPGGRDRPFPDTSKPLFAQKLTGKELTELGIDIYKSTPRGYSV